MLDQRLSTVADALSRRDSPEESVYALSTPTFQLYKELEADCAQNREWQHLHAQIQEGSLGDPWHMRDGLILHGQQIFVPASSPIIPAILESAHSAGHGGIQKTLHRLRTDFFLTKHRALVKDWVRSCVICQKNKTEAPQPAGLVQPLEVPTQIWTDIAMDFVAGLPKVHGKSVILTVVDRFSKYAHLIALSHPYTAATVARAFFDGIVRLHGFPSSIVSDRDPVFIGHVWKDLFKLAGVTLRMSTTFHPQTYGQSEVVNKTIAMYLRCITGDRPRAWVNLLAWAEYCYNTSYHSALKTTPFRVVYGRDPPPLIPYQLGTAATQVVDQMLHEHDLFLGELRDRLLQAQEHACRFYDGKHRELEFSVDDWVWLRLLHRQAQSPVDRPKGKLGPRYAGPFRVIEKVGFVAYRLELPKGAHIHDGFHVGLLKPFRCTPPLLPPDTLPMENGWLLPTPEKVLRARAMAGASAVEWSAARRCHLGAYAIVQSIVPSFSARGRAVRRGRDKCYVRQSVQPKAQKGS
jgi:hypothetical protein